MGERLIRVEGEVATVTGDRRACGLYTVGVAREEKIGMLWGSRAPDWERRGAVFSGMVRGECDSEGVGDKLTDLAKPGDPDETAAANSAIDFTGVTEIPEAEPVDAVDSGLEAVPPTVMLASEAARKSRW